MYERYEELIKQLKITTYKLCKDTGIPASTFSDWKKGKSVPKAEKMQKIADYLGVTIDYLLGNSEFKTRDEMFQHYQNEIEDINKNEESFKNSPLNPYYNLTQDEIDKIESYKAYLISQRSKKENSAMGE